MKAVRFSQIILTVATVAVLAATARAGAPAKTRPAKSTRSAKADALAGKVVAVRGKVTALKGKAERRLKMKGAIYRGDSISTGKRGRIQVMFTDKTLMNLGPGSTLVVEKYLFGKGKKPEIQTRLKEGVLRVMGGKISKLAPKRFKVKTPTATIGIRGSMWAARLRDGVLLVVQFGGKGVDVYTARGSVPLTRPRQGTYVRGAGQAPEKPRMVPLPVLQSLIGSTLVAGTDGGAGVPPPPPPMNKGRDRGGDDKGGEKSDSFWNPYDDTMGMVGDAVTSGTQAAALALITDLPLEGYFMLGMKGPNGVSLADDEIRRGLADAVSEDGDLRGTAVGNLFRFRTRVPTLRPIGGFTHFEKKQTTVTWNLAGADRKLPMTYAHDNLGQFMTFWTDENNGATFDDGGVHKVNSLGYVGVPAFGMPGNGIKVYGSLGSGGVHMTQIRNLEINGSLEHVSENITAAINYRNKQFVGVLWEPDGGGKCELLVVRGEVDGNRLRNLDFFGIGDRYNDPSKTWILEGTGLHGGIYGSQAQAIGFAGRGDGWRTETGTNKLAEWYTAGAAFLDPEKSTSSSPTGVKHMRGFMLGVSEDYQPSTPMGLTEVYNNYDGKFTLTADLDKGHFAGSATLDDGSHQLIGMQIGGSHGSTLVSQDVMAGHIGGGSVASGSFLPRGHAMVSDFKKPLNMPWASWGIWVASYDQGAGDWQVTEGMWVAGVKTPAAEVQALIDANFSATYTGPARIVRIPSGPSGAQMFHGNVNLNIGFGGGGSVAGSIAAGPVNMTVGGGGQTVTNSGFGAAITQVNGGGASGMVKGIFCGKNAQGIVGMGRASAGSYTYQTTFAGKR